MIFSLAGNERWLGKIVYRGIECAAKLMYYGALLCFVNVK